MRFIDRRALREKQELARQLRRESTPEEKILWRELRTNKLGNLIFAGNTYWLDSSSISTAHRLV
jgi:very-short-patch-repair endonuclease